MSCTHVDMCRKYLTQHNACAESRRVDESLVHLLSELPQLLAGQGRQLQEATQKVEKLQLEVQEIIGKPLSHVEATAEQSRAEMSQLSRSFEKMLGCTCTQA